RSKRDWSSDVCSSDLQSYIDKCITSLLEQTHTNLEIIIIDDFSTLECQTKLKQIEDSDERIFVYKLDAHKGVGAARNLGIKKANGEIIYFIDSDDFLTERTLELLVNNIRYYPIIRGITHITYFSNSLELIFDALFNVTYFQNNKFNLINKSGVHNFLIRTSFIHDNQLCFSEDFKIYSDLLFMVK